MTKFETLQLVASATLIPPTHDSNSYQCIHTRLAPAQAEMLHHSNEKCRQY